MTYRTLAPRLLALGLSIASACAGARQPIKIESIAHLPEIQSVSMSADGKNLVALTMITGHIRHYLDEGQDEI